MSVYCCHTSVRSMSALVNWQRVIIFLETMFFQIRVVNAFRSSLYETPHYKRSMNSLQSIHDFLPLQPHYGDDDDEDTPGAPGEN